MEQPITKLEKLIAGLKLIHKYQPNAHLTTDTNTFIVGDTRKDNLTPEDRNLLKSLGFFEHNKYDSWCTFI